MEIQVKLTQQSHIFIQFGGIAGCLVVRDVGDEVAVPSLQLIYDHGQLTDGQRHLPSVILLLLACLHLFFFFFFVLFNLFQFNLIVQFFEFVQQDGAAGGGPGELPGAA